MNRLRLVGGHMAALSRSWSSVASGAKYSKDFKQYLKLSNGELGSYWHDVPLNLAYLSPKEFSDYAITFNMVVENSKFSNGKFEIQLNEIGNPIRQDTYKNGELRYVPNLFPLKGYPMNYGALPQTWESPLVKLNGYPGDNDPLDCCEIGSKVQPMGSVIKVKLLGSLALIDDDEMDWKLIVIDTEDPISGTLNSLQDVDQLMPNYLKLVKDWFQNYKVPQGKPPNKFAFNGEYLNSEKTISVIQSCNKSWRDLVSGELEGKSGIPNAARSASNDINTLHNVNEKPLTVPQNVNKWYFL